MSKQLITILGQTSSGKTQLSLDVAHQLIKENNNVLIVSCDSRQIYQSLNLGTGKPIGEWKPFNKKVNAYYIHDIPHFLIDFVNPKVRYSMAEYLSQWCILFEKLQDYRGIVLLVGGTGLWAKAVNGEYQPGIIKQEFQTQYSNFKNFINSKSLADLQSQLPLNHGLNPSDYNNTRRVINYLLRSEASLKNWAADLIFPQFESKKVYCISIDQNTLYESIDVRLQQRINEGLIDEVKSLLYLEDRLLELGLEYRLTYYYLLGQLTQNEWRRKLLLENINYAKRQLTWLQKQPSIPISNNDQRKIVQSFTSLTSL